MKKITNQIYNWILSEKNSIFLSFFFSFLYFGVNTFLNYATDTYSTFQGLHSAAGDMITRNGRILTGAIYYLWYYSGISNENFYYISSLLALVFLAAALYLLQKIIDQFTDLSDIQRIIISFLCIANIYIIEYFMFLEKCMFMFSIFCNVLAFHYTLRWIKNKGKKRYALFSAILLTLAAFAYQGTLALYIILSIPFVLKYSFCIKQYLYNGFFVILNYGFSCGLNLFVLVFILKSSRVHEADFMKNFMTAIRGMKAYSLTTFHILPYGIFTGVLFFLLLISIVCILGKYKGIMLGVQLLNIIIIFLGTFLSSVASIIMGSGWFAPRVIYPFASILGIYMINLHVNILSSADNIIVKHSIQKCAAFAAIIILVLQYFSFQKIFIDKYLNNELDQYRCMAIAEQIKTYEETHNTTIQYISFYTDANEDIQYPDLYSSGDFIVSSFITDWSDINALNYYLNKNYVKLESNPEYTEYFKLYDWKTFSTEQLIFDGNTLHLCIY